MTTAWILALLAVVVTVRLGWPRARVWWEWRRHCRRLARRHGLSEAQASLLWRLARRTTPKLPLLVFVRPSLLARAEHELDASEAEVADLRARLFSG